MYYCYPTTSLAKGFPWPVCLILGDIYCESNPEQNVVLGNEAKFRTIAKQVIRQPSDQQDTVLWMRSPPPLFQDSSPSSNANRQLNEACRTRTDPAWNPAALPVRKHVFRRATCELSLVETVSDQNFFLYWVSLLARFLSNLNWITERQCWFWTCQIKKKSENQS